MSNKNSKINILVRGIILENPVFVLLLGLCPFLGVSNQVINSIGMGLAVLFVLICSNVAISLLKNLIPDKVRIPAYIVIIATFVTVVELVMHAFTPELYNNMATFIVLIVVNCIVLGRAEAFASKNNVVDSVLDAIGMSIGFFFALFLMATIREVFGSGTFLGFRVPILADNPIRVIGSPAGAMIVMGLLLAFFNFLKDYLSKRSAKKVESLEVVENSLDSKELNTEEAV
ncbi:MAG: electron transport complex subunit E [Spirochaetales bacterium]|nr:electron transport complex subunit E [Spirochaetales bacterium]